MTIKTPCQESTLPTQRRRPPAKKLERELSSRENSEPFSKILSETTTALMITKMITSRCLSNHIKETKLLDSPQWNVSDRFWSLSWQNLKTQFTQFWTRFTRNWLNWQADWTVKSSKDSLTCWTSSLRLQTINWVTWRNKQRIFWTPWSKERCPQFSQMTAVTFQQETTLLLYLFDVI